MSMHQLVQQVVHSVKLVLNVAGEFHHNVELVTTVPQEVVICLTLTGAGCSK